jgi:hypothetical protein
VIVFAAPVVTAPMLAPAEGRQTSVNDNPAPAMTAPSHFSLLCSFILSLSLHFSRLA